MGVNAIKNTKVNVHARVSVATHITYAELIHWLKVLQGFADLPQEGFKGDEGLKNEERPVKIRSTFPDCYAAMDQTWSARSKMAFFKKIFNGEVVFALTDSSGEPLLDALHSCVRDSTNSTSTSVGNFRFKP